MHKTLPEARALAEGLAASLADGAAGRADVVLCPPFTALGAVGQAIAGSGLHLGAQNVHWRAEGAFTGEISPGMLVDLACRYAIVGHSERRQWFGEDDETVARRAKAALAAGLVPIVCVGENWQEREQGETESKVAFQVRAALGMLAGEEAHRVAFAYEPLWAIGTGHHADGATAGAVGSLIRREVARLVGTERAGAVRILYGGSVKPGNIAEFAAQPDLDGALVGGASLEAASFAAIVQGWLAAKEGRVP